MLFAGGSVLSRPALLARRRLGRLGGLVSRRLIVGASAAGKRKHQQRDRDTAKHTAWSG
jgi:hypothetical protein